MSNKKVYTRVLVLYNGKDAEEIKSSTQVVIASYELSAQIIALKKHMKQDKSPRFQSIILDESHYIKGNTKRSENCLSKWIKLDNFKGSKCP